MRKQIAAANWKMNLTYQQAETLLSDVLDGSAQLTPNQQVIFSVPFPYLIMANSRVANEASYFIAAQNCSDKKAGAFTGEVSAEMLHSIGITYCVIGHSERREFFIESNKTLADKVALCLQYDIIPIFCCGEPLSIREKGGQNEFVRIQLEESLFQLGTEQFQKVIIAYEPIWAIGTGRTATTEQAQEMHHFLRSVIAEKFGPETAAGTSILYGGSVKASNAAEIFGSPDVDGGLVGGASLQASEFQLIIKALKQ
jgi:triosephosphate isomerase